MPNYSLFGEKLNEAQDLESVNLYLFINCGGTVDLTEYEFISRVKVILFDVHKPIHHKNIECPSVQV